MGRAHRAMTFAEIAEREGISRQRAQQIFESAMRKLRRRRRDAAILQFYADALAEAREGRGTEPIL